MRNELDDAINGVLDDGRFVLGEPVDQFEHRFAAYCGASQAISVASGTDAITIALQAVGVAPGDEVITVANTCVPTVAGIEAAGASPILVDPDADTFTLDPATLESALTERTTAIVPVHLYGQCADMDPIVAFAVEHGLKVVEDAAQAVGATYLGTRSGTLGDAAAFSFYPTKNLGALGDGGAIVTNDVNVGERARLLRSYGERARYDSIVSGRNSRLDAIQAAVLSAKLRHLDGWTARRRELAARYREGLGDLPVTTPAERAGSDHVFHLYVIRVEARDAFREALENAGVQTLIHYPRAVHEQPAYRHLAFDRGKLGRSERLSREVVSLPLFPELTDEEVDEVITAVRGVVSGRRRDVGS